MSFSAIFIRRPVLSTVLSLMILLIGALSFLGLSVRQYPEVEETVITITTAYPGASADVIQGFLTAPIARAVSTAENVDYVSSSSRQSVSTVSVHMQLGADPDTALTEIMSKVQQIGGALPSDSEDPVIQPGTGMQFAIMYLAVQSAVMSGEELTEYLERVIRPRMSTIDGVAEVQVLGAQNFAMRVWIDPVRLAARDITASEVLRAINQANFLSAPGSTENEYVTYPISMETTLPTPARFGALPLRSEGDDVVRLRDVAEVALGAESDDTIVTINGQSGQFLGIFPSPAANPIDVATAVRAELPAIVETLPDGMDIELVFDATESISASIDEVFLTIGEAVAIVIVVILLFLGSFRSVLIPIATIPLSLIGVCFFLLAMGYSINTLTLLAMVLAIGLVVDDAIVVVENIHRHIEEGKPPLEAALTGMREITGAIVAMTLTLVAVFAPLAFTAGLTGALFREFAVTLAGSVLISGLIALTLSPMMAGRLPSPHGGSRFQRFVDRRLTGLENWYHRRVASSLDYRPVTVLVVAAVLGTTAFLFTNTASELAPEEDQGALFAVINAPRYATTDYTQAYIDQIAARTADVPAVETQFSIASPSMSFSIWGLVDWSERTLGQSEVQQMIQGRIAGITGVQTSVFAPPSLPGAGGGLPVSYVLQTTGPPSQVYEIAEEVRRQAMMTGRFIIVQNSLAYDVGQVRVTIDREQAAALGVPISEIGATLSVLVGEARVSRFDRDSNSYDIIPQVPADFRMNPEALSAYYVRSASGAMVPLSAVIAIETGVAPAAIEQFNQLNSATLSALPMPGVTTADALDTLRGIARPLMPSGFFENYAGQSRLEVVQGDTIVVAFALAVVVIFLVLSAQFESFRDPLIIMTTVPLSTFGAIVPLNLGLATLNIYTQVGLITLIGLITKHGILMVQFANQQRAAGHDKRSAIAEAARVRLRPILMTTAAMTLAVVPLLQASGAGAAARFSMGLVIFSGLLVGTLFTLFVVPTFYTLISRPDRAAATSGAEAPATVTG